MAQRRPTRKQRFEAALKLAGMTLEQWCADVGVSRQHLLLGFKGERVFSAELSAKIDRFTAKQLSENAA